MRYKTISSAIAVLLLATPVFAQIIVETPRTTTPTTVITGQPFRQTYVIKFIDLTHLGEEIIIKKEDLDQKFMGGFEVISFKTEYETKQGRFLEHWWYLNYTLRVIDPKKGPKVIPSFVVPWKHKKAGQQENDPTLQYNYELKTDEVDLNYVTTIPEKDTSLTIRDLIDLGSFKMRGLVLYYTSWFIAIVPMGLWLAFYAKRLSTSGTRTREEELKNSKPEEVDGKGVSRISKRRALRNLKQAVRKLSKSEGSESIHKSVSDVLVSIKDYLRIKASLNVGTTPLEMVSAISADKNLKSSREPLLELAERAVVYQDYIESGLVPVTDTLSEAMELRRLINNLSWPRRLFRSR